MAAEAFCFTGGSYARRSFTPWKTGSAAGDELDKVYLKFKAEHK
jgi:hypothetical protein